MKNTEEKITKKPIVKEEKPTEEVEEKSDKQEKEESKDDKVFRKPYENGLTWEWEGGDLTSQPLFRTICRLVDQDPYAVVDESSRLTEIISQLGKYIIEKVGCNENEIAKELSHLKRLLPIGSGLTGLYEIARLERIKELRKDGE